MEPKITLVLGGAASGKSAFAENLVFQSGKPRHYWATSQVFDAEMAEKVRLHLAQRGADWATVEEPQDATVALAGIHAGDILLMDCATMWLTNHLLAENDLTVATDQLLAAFADCPAEIIVVSNETGMGIVPENALARRFREAQGRLNITLAARADRVVQVVAGLPNVLKGAL